MLMGIGSLYIICPLDGSESNSSLACGAPRNKIICNSIIYFMRHHHLIIGYLTIFEWCWEERIPNRG